MEKFTRNVKGSISLFLSMIILLLVILEGFLIDGSKVLAGKMMMSSAGDMTLNAGLTYYEETLRDIYGLFAASETEEDLKANLEVYFRKTLGDITGESEGEYVDQMMEYIDQVIKTGWDGEEAGRLLDLQLDTFSAKGIESSALSEPYVIRSQILEYMKYRGPASLGYGMLEKIHAFKELDKQQKTLEAKLDYEEKMSDIQKSCEDAYNNIVPYNQLLEGALKPETLEEASRDINKNIREAILAVWCYSAAKRDFNLDKNWMVKTSVSGTDVEAAVEACSLLNDMYVAYEAASSALDDGFDKHPYGTMCAIKITLGYTQEFEHYKNLYTTWENYLKDYAEKKKALEEELEQLDEDEDGSGIEEELEELKEEKEKCQELYEDAKQTIDQCGKILDGAVLILQEDINERVGAAVGKIDSIAGYTRQLKELGEYGIEALDDVLDNLDKLEALGNTWQSSIDQLSSGDIKTSMQLDLDNKSEDLDREKIQILQEKLTNGVSYADMLLQAIGETQAVTFKLYEGQKSDYAQWLRISMKATPFDNETLAQNVGSYAAFDADLWEENAKNTQAMETSAYTTYLVDPSGGKQSGTGIQMDLSAYAGNMDYISGKNDEFFKYLERVCPKKEAEKESKKDAENAKKRLLEEAMNADLNPDGELPSLSSNVTDKTDSGRGSFSKTDQGASDKTVSSNAKKNSKSSADFLSSVGELLVSGRDKLYLTEYATQMFSCYTVEKMTKESDKETLSGHPFTAADNQMYKAEVEYILWGNPSGTEDVKYTLSTIFGIRFLLNSLYAFTGDPEIRQLSLALATSIAGWTGFGVPLVQSVIILAFALAETALDIEALKQGKSVPIYKSQSNWCMKPSGSLSSGSRNMIEDMISNAGSAAKEYLFEQMDQLTESTKDKFKDTFNDYVLTTVGDIVDAASATVLIPLQERLVGLVNVVSPSKEEIAAKIEEAVQNLKTTIAQEDDSIMRDAKLNAVELFQSDLQGRLIKEIQSIQNSEMSNKEITEKIYQVFEEYATYIKRIIRPNIQTAVNSEAEAVNQVLDSSNENMQKNVSEAMDKMLIRINCGVSFADLEGTVNVDGAKGRTSGSAALTMNYKEYLWLFIAVKSVTNEDEMLTRIGNLIEANLAYSEAKPAPDFRMSTAYTFIEVDATADLSTTFFALPIPVTGGGNVTLGQDQYSIGYRGVLGY